MHFDGSVPIKADRQKVWAFVNDPNQVGACGPGVESVTIVDGQHFKVVARVGIGIDQGHLWHRCHAGRGPCT